MIQEVDNQRLWAIKESNNLTLLIHYWFKFPEGNLKATLFGLKGNLGFIVEEIEIDTQD